MANPSAMGGEVITVDYVQHMARYNRWMNEKIYAASGKIGEEERKADRGAFFKSVHSTLNHLVWGDYMWLGRFTKGTPLEKDYPKAPVGSDLFFEWEELMAARKAMDDDIEAWAATVKKEWLQKDFAWLSGITQSTRSKPAWILVTHLFNHQTHHRGQVATLLMQQGVDPGVTDLPMMPDQDR